MAFIGVFSLLLAGTLSFFIFLFSSFLFLGVPCRLRDLAGQRYGNGFGGAASSTHVLVFRSRCPLVKILVRWGKGKRSTGRLSNLSKPLPPWNGPDMRVDVPPTRGSNLWGSKSIFSDS